MSQLTTFLKIIDIMGDTMTEDQVIEFMDRAKQELAIAEMEALMEHVAFHPNAPKGLYTQMSMYEGEMGGFGRY